jgi:cytochrome bd-type quinol oxidase subunit 2
MKDNVKEAGLPVSLLTITYVMALLQIFLLSTSIFPVIIPPMLHIHSSVTNTI